MLSIDFSAPGDFYPSRRTGRKAPLHYRRFNTVAEAVRHAIEEVPPSQLIGTLIESEEHRYEGEAISVLYKSDGYPLRRLAAGA